MPIGPVARPESSPASSRYAPPSTPPSVIVPSIRALLAHSLPHPSDPRVTVAGIQLQPTPLARPHPPRLTPQPQPPPDHPLLVPSPSSLTAHFSQLTPSSPVIPASSAGTQHPDQRRRSEPATHPSTALHPPLPVPFRSHFSPFSPPALPPTHPPTRTFPPPVFIGPNQPPKNAPKLSLGGPTPSGGRAAERQFPPSPPLSFRAQRSGAGSLP